MKTNPSVSIIVLNYNGEHFLEECFNSLKKLNYPAEKLEYILVDNYSADNSVELVRKKFPFVKIIQNKRNLGCPGGYNSGAKFAKGDFLLFLNNDLEIDSNYLIEVIRKIDLTNKIVCVACKILDFFSPKIQAGIPWYHILGYAGFLNNKKPQTIRFKSALVPWSSSCAFFIQKEPFYQLKGFDSTFFPIYADDLDFSLRLWLFGYKITYNPKAIVYHKGKVNRSEARNTYLNERNKLKLIIKLYQKSTLTKIIMPLIILRFFMVLYYLLQKDFPNAKAILKAFRGIIPDRILLNSRREIQEKRILNDRSLTFLSPPLKYIITKELY